MSLTEMALNLETRLRRILNSEVREQRAAEIRERTSALETSIIPRLQRARMKRQVIQNCHLQVEWPAGVPPQDLEAYHPESPAAQAEWANLKPRLVNFATSAESLVNTAIQASKQQFVALVAPEELAGFMISEATRAEAEALLAIHTPAVQEDWKQCSQERLTTLLAGVGAFQDRLTALRIRGASPELLAFLAEVRAPAGAPYARLTPELLAQAQDHNFINNIRLKWI